MSGRKRIQVDESAWYRLLKSADELKVIRRDLPDLLEGVRAQTRADLDREFDEVRRRQQRSDEAVRQLGEQNRALEEETNRRLRAQAVALQQQLADTTGRLRAETRARLEEQRQVFERGLAAERSERRAAQERMAAEQARLAAEQARLAGEVKELTDDRERAAKLAAAWLADADRMADLIADTLPHERYAPDELAGLRRRLAEAHRTAAQGRHDAALAVAQEGYHSLSELRVKVEQADLLHRTWQDAAVQAVLLVERQVEQGALLPVLGPDQQEIPGYELDVDYWSAGSLTELRERLGEAAAQARASGTGTAELERICREEAPAFETQLADAVRRARLSQLASQIRVNLADEVAQVLAETAFYSFVDAEFADADQRGAYFARLQHENGNEIVLDIGHLEGPDGGNVIRVISLDHDTEADADLRARALAVRRALAERGRQVEGPVTEPDVTPEPGRYDVAVQRERGRRQEQQQQEFGRATGSRQQQPGRATGS
ncbi:hypothetical protein ACIA8O_22530 [Kitasatospora sp. NPDC051853]|uniref:hypothetical protein n=1 Tax=Kitasatospora sp. NPDC051853 TaxID=3364058 RepID=UPI0037888206